VVSDEPANPTRAPEVPSSTDEPAVTGDGGSVPEVAAWQRAADDGAAARERAGASPERPASAVLPDILRVEVVEWLWAALPNEGCGVLVADRSAADGGVPTRFVGMRNAAQSPYRYLMDSEELLRVMLQIDDADEVVWGVVHSHVASPPYPSSTDVGLAAYPDAVYLLASFASQPPEVRAWSIVDGAVEEIALE
jgi:proteasome lid subunit RPN8/RPN11